VLFYDGEREHGGADGSALDGPHRPTHHAGDRVALAVDLWRNLTLGLALKCRHREFDRVIIRRPSNTIESTAVSIALPRHAYAVSSSRTPNKYRRHHKAGAAR
jgi:hypothetical protein